MKRKRYTHEQIISTLKRDDMIRAGRHDELPGVTGDTRASQDAILKEDSESCG